MRRLVILWIGLQVGCAAPIDGVEHGAEHEAAATAESGAALTIGSRGAEVRALYEFLVRYGYFPNAELAARYPGFRPIIAEPPADPSAYDSRLAEAVLRYQENMGLTATGEADAETLALTRQARCEWPDGYEGALGAEHSHASEDGTVDKFSHLYSSRQNWTWSIDSWPAGVTESSMISLTQSMINQWKNVYPASLTRVARGQGAVKINFEEIDGPVDPDAINPDGTCNLDVEDHGCILGKAGSGITLDREERWEFGGTPSTGELDYRSIVLHEIGHKLGMGHSDRQDAVMYANNQGRVKRYLHADDRLAVRSKYSVWTQIVTPAPATDVGAAGSVYWISNERTGGGYRIYRWINGSQHELLDGGAVRVAVDSRERAWVVNDVGHIYYRREDNSGWRHVPGCARDIAVIYRGPVYVVGCNGHAYIGNMDPNQPDSVLDTQRQAGFTYLSPTGGYAHTELTNVGSFGDGATSYAAMFTDVTGRVWISVFWMLQPIQVDNPIVAHDIGGALDGQALWVTRRNGTEKGIFALNVQSERVNTPHRSGWVGYPTTSAVRVAVQSNGRPYYVNEVGTLMTTSR